MLTTVDSGLIGLVWKYFSGSANIPDNRLSANFEEKIWKKGRKLTYYSIENYSII